MLEQAMWTHGHSMTVEYPSQLVSEWRPGFYIRVVGKPGSTNWFHFAVPTPVIVNDNRLRIDSALVRFRSNSNSADITAIHVYDGEKKIASHDGLNLSPSNWTMHRFDVPGHPEVLWGIGISIGVKFSGANDSANTMEIAAAGADFLP